MLGQILQPEIKDLINSRDFTSLKEVLIDWTPADIADLLTDLPDHEQAILFRILPKDLATDTFEYLEVDVQLSLLKALGNEEVAFILNDMSPDDRTAMLEEVPASALKQMMNLLSVEERHIAQSLLGYPENSVGRLMTPDYLAIRENWTVQEVLDYIRNNGKDIETLSIIYVTNEKGKLIDDIKIRKFLLAPTESSADELMDGNFTYLQVFDDQEKAVEVFKKYDRVALPVTDSSGILVGIVTVDDVLDVAEEEATEDFQKLGAVEALEDSYAAIPLLQMIKKRAGWLSVLFVGELFTASAMGFFETEISKAVVLALFVPLIISSGGNSGSQAATLVIRALSLGEVSIRDWFFVMKREIISGIILGSILALLGFMRITLWQNFTGIYGPHWLPIAFTVSFALVGVVLWGTLMGSMLPLVLKKIGFDPAVSSAPFVATLVDVTGLMIYFSIALLLLKGTLL
ncbi:MAG: magnesium transporter [Ignavibacteria bacterium CG_4_8_14_3_um_filter_37_9]|nr:magnesium transporter [Ignavibacteria bacterium]OIO16633.1 MAG: magnesium transporter [Ignavibacteria bacterium CG1_02_37_35]PIP78210.1 MAG: magnesium transporter [Ignavibacteria bacterium CG22_combo_CG10-13_8_21_14_all_37_15]PIS43779.1 MAG: magnesium transporter [Ignavibacteria bacterium CG08_land_8_20_14_0_20_37_9]PIX00205.1 MAG: magnesium transporter [Ignavibacteria bacterium CG_4_8_14_3_um_filter_37_9]PIX95330.1 MAG: magnesium transporter [Ignavibacteria bacterium CG_4_10_14_3_um_filter